jgi:transposase
MYDLTALLFGLKEFQVVDVAPTSDRDRVRVVIAMTSAETACPTCGVFSALTKGRPERRIKDLPASSQVVQLWWRKRRLKCVEDSCPARSLTQTNQAITARSRLTGRLREKLAHSIAKSNRSISDVVGEYEVSWPTANEALAAAVDQWLPEPEPTRVFGMDETRARSVKWVFEENSWTRTNPSPHPLVGIPQMTSFVDADPNRPVGLLGLTPGRSGACESEWLSKQTQEFRDGIEVVVIDPSAPYASGVRRALPGVKIAVDHWHFVKLETRWSLTPDGVSSNNNGAGEVERLTRCGRTDCCC